MGHVIAHLWDCDFLWPETVKRSGGRRSSRLQKEFNGMMREGPDMTRPRIQFATMLSSMVTSAKVELDVCPRSCPDLRNVARWKPRHQYEIHLKCGYFRWWSMMYTNLWYRISRIWLMFNDQKKLQVLKGRPIRTKVNAAGISLMDRENPRNIGWVIPPKNNQPIETKRAFEHC